MESILTNRVHIALQEKLSYPVTPPFHPSDPFPEYPFSKLEITPGENVVYAMVRDTLCGMGLDKENQRTSSWNPLKEVVCPGDTVLIKPNLVLHRHKILGNEGRDALITHASVIRPIIDYVIIALRGSGRIILGDAPIQFCDFSELIKEFGYFDLVAFYRGKGVDIVLKDFRLYMSKRKGKHLAPVKTTTDEEKEANCQTVDLGEQSRLRDIEKKYRRFRVTNYDPDEMIKHHHIGKHQYLIHKAVLEADVVINVPKLKTHRKAGITCALKNMVGINGIKDCLPHHTRGAVSEGGDEYLHKNFLKKWYMDIQEVIDRLNIQGRPWLSSMLYELRRPLGYVMRRTWKDPFMEGSWYGNDTVWRTALDLNTIIIYADKDGRLQETPQRRYMALVDGIVAGEKEGPLLPSPKKCGVIVLGFNPAVVDATISEIAGFGFKHIPIISNCFTLDHHPLVTISPQDIWITTNHDPAKARRLNEIRGEYNLRLLPTTGWQQVLSNGRDNIKLGFE